MTTTHYILPATDVAKLREALAINRVMAKDDQGNYTREVTPKVITEALALIDSAQGVGVVGRTFMLAGIQHGAFTHVIGDQELYAAIQGDSNEG